MPACAGPALRGQAPFQQHHLQPRAKLGNEKSFHIIQRSFPCFIAQEHQCLCAVSSLSFNSKRDSGPLDTGH